MNPSGLCLCGCGGKTKIASCTYRTRGWVKGEPVDYLHGHYAKVSAHKDNQRSVMRERARRTQKQGPYKAGRTVMAKAAVGKIEAALRRKA